MARANKCPNPAAKSNATGYSGTASPSRVTGLSTLPRTTGVQATGTGYIQTPTAPCSPGDQFAVSVYTQNGSAAPLGTKTVYVAYTRSAGGDAFPETFSTTVGNVGDTNRGTFVAAAAPALATGIYLIVDAITAGVVVSDVMYEPGTSVGAYADGDTSGWVWDGTNGNSSSSESTSESHPTTGTAQVSMSATATEATKRNTAGTARVSMRATALSSGGTVEGVHYEIEDIMDALASTFNGVATGDTIGGSAITIEAHAEVTGQIEPPAIVLELDNQDFDLNMASGADSLSVVALLLVTYQDTDNAQRLLWRFLSRGVGSGLFRVKQALENNQSLDGLVSYAIMTTVRNIGIVTYNGVDYLGAELVIEVVS